MTAKHEPEDWQRRVVERLSGLGIKQEVICAAVGVSKQTLHNRYGPELDRGNAEAQEKIGQALFEKAVVSKDTACLIFLAKTRLGFQEVNRSVNETTVRHVDERGSPRERVERRLAGLRVVGGTDSDSTGTDG